MTKRHCLVSENFVHRGDLNIRHSKSGHIHNLIQNFNVNGHLTGLDKMVLFANAVSVMSEKGYWKLDTMVWYWDHGQDTKHLATGQFYLSNTRQVRYYDHQNNQVIKIKNNCLVG